MDKEYSTEQQQKIDSREREKLSSTIDGLVDGLVDFSVILNGATLLAIDNVANGTEDGHGDENAKDDAKDVVASQEVDSVADLDVEGVLLVLGFERETNGDVIAVGEGATVNGKLGGARGVGDERFPFETLVEIGEVDLEDAVGGEHTTDIEGGVGGDGAGGCGVSGGGDGAVLIEQNDEDQGVGANAAIAKGGVVLADEREALFDQQVARVLNEGRASGVEDDVTAGRDGAIVVDLSATGERQIDGGAASDVGDAEGAVDVQVATSEGLGVVVGQEGVLADEVGGVGVRDEPSLVA